MQLMFIPDHDIDFDPSYEYANVVWESVKEFESQGWTPCGTSCWASVAIMKKPKEDVV